MKKVFFFIFLAISSLLYSQQCYRDGLNYFLISHDKNFAIGFNDGSGFFGSLTLNEKESFMFIGETEFSARIKGTDLYLSKNLKRVQTMQLYLCSDDDLKLLQLARLKKF